MKPWLHKLLYLGLGYVGFVIMLLLFENSSSTIRRATFAGRRR